MPIITLTTDFGSRDPYVAAMKGVLRRHCPDVTIDDLTHEITPQDILETALFLEAAMPWYPEDTVHLVVVDPGVGTKRRPIAARAGGHIFVGPDNGLMTLWLLRHQLEWAFQIKAGTNANAVISNTFHGRDIFAPAAAWLANGGEPHALGEAIDSLQQLQLPLPKRDGPYRYGVIIHIDRFGNCVTNIQREQEAHPSPGGTIHVGDHVFPLHTTYGDVDAGAPLALYGSSGRLEIAVNQGNAARQFGLARMMAVTLKAT